MNVYYILDINKNQLKGLLNALSNRELEITVGDFSYTRFNNSDTKCIFKTKRGIIKIPAFLNASQSCNHAEIIEVLNTDEWKQPEETK